MTDYTDALAPERTPQWAPVLGRFGGLVAAAELQGLRWCAGYEPHIEVVPDGSNLVIAARATYEARIKLQANSFIWAIACYSDQAAGFTLSFSDLTTGATLTNKPIRSSQATGGTAVTAEGLTSRLFVLPAPIPVPAPGLVRVEMTNRAEVDADCQVSLFIAQPGRQALPSTPANADLAARLERYSRARHSGGTAGGSSSSSAIVSGGSAAVIGTAAAASDSMPSNGRPFHYVDALALPAAGESAAIVRFTVPAGHNAAVKGITALYVGTGFIEGSGALVWRVTVDGVSHPGFDSLKTSLGDLGSPYHLPGAIIARSGQVVELSIKVTEPPAGGTHTIGGFDGWFYPAN